MNSSNKILNEGMNSLKMLWSAFLVMLWHLQPIHGQTHDNGFNIHADFPGGNILVEKIVEDTVWLAPDTRNISGDWFYWYFGITTKQDRPLRFVFPKNNIPSFGPSISLDGGSSWKWMFDKLQVGLQEFSFSFPANQEIRFSMGFPYTKTNFDSFMANYTSHPWIQLDTLCCLKSGHIVPMVHIKKNQNPRGKIILTARHHACEMMVNYAIEGFITSLIQTDKYGWLTQNFEILIIPFVDLDGVENGDQGKNRIPRDHNRDYSGESIYETTKAIRAFVPEWAKDDLWLALDMHCPGLVGKGHELLYLVGSKAPIIAQEEAKFASILQETTANGLSFRASSLLPFGSSWNVAISERQGDSFRTWVQNNVQRVKLATTLEIPYANNEGQRVSVENLQLFGSDLAEAMERYLKSVKEKQ